MKYIDFSDFLKKNKDKINRHIELNVKRNIEGLVFINKGEIEMSHSTSTFTLEEIEELDTFYPFMVYIHYCSYCTKKANFDIIGGRRDEHISYFCNCKKAKMERALKEEIAATRHKIHKLNNQIEELLVESEQEEINKRKYKYELIQLQNKYKIKDENK